MRLPIDAHAFLEPRGTRSDDAFMSPELERRAVTMFLLTLLAIVALSERDPKTLALALSVVAALLSRIVAFYFPRAGSERKRMLKEKRRS
jgi:hypothetical protein